MTVLRWGSATDQGLVRRNNQDNLLVTGTVFAVADGMGGHAGGEVASAVAVAALAAAFDHREERGSTDDLLAAVHAANAAVFDRAATERELRGMGTTLTAAALVSEAGEERLAIANVGDSRAYVFTQGELTQLTEDHSVAEELVRQGQLDPADVDSHPQRHILTRALGILPEVEIDLWEVLPFSGDRVILCSDGLVREVTDDQIASVLRRLVEPGEAAKELVAKARAAGGSDNITVVIIDVVDDDDRSLIASDALRADSAGTHQATREVFAVPSDGAIAGGERAAASSSDSSDPLPTPPKRRRVTLRVVAFIVVLLAVLAAASGAVVLYARGSYFVTFGPPGSGAASSGPVPDPTARQLLVYKGRPGGLLWFEPTLAERSDVTSDQVLPARIGDLARGKLFASRAAANTYIENLKSEAIAVQQATTTTTTPAPTTTVPAPPAPTTSAP